MLHPAREADLASEEIELKFLGEPRDLDAVLAAVPGDGAKTRNLVSTYFDTPDSALSRAHISLRLRDGGDHRVQTLKRGEGFAREEHEGPAPKQGLDLTIPALKQALRPAQRRSLAPVYTVDINRRQRTFMHGGARIELAVDLGEVRAGDRRRPISELELELKDGPREALFDLARELSRIAPLYLSFDGKASQGQALRDGAERTPRHGDKARLRRGVKAGAAFQAIARNALTQIAANALILREADSDETLHQLRVAVRRLRSAISTFRPLVEDAAAPAVKGELKWLSAACDEARDLDVFARDNAVLAPGATGLDSAVAAARTGAHAKACAAVASKRFRDLLLEATAWVETGPWLSAEGKARKLLTGSAREFATTALARRWKATLRRGARLKSRSDSDRHELRIEAKKLRYAMESLAPLFDARRSARFVKRLKTLQDELGALNDAAVAARLVDSLGPTGPGADAADQLLAARKALRPAKMKSVAKAFARLSDAQPPWVI